MSDSDDTELLLLIPHDFFLLRESESEASLRSNLTEPQNTLCNCLESQNKSCFESQNIRSNNCIKEKVNMSSSYHYHLPPRQQNEIDKINAKISQVERNFSGVESDISTTSNQTMRSNFVPTAKNLVHRNDCFATNTTSTPKNLPKYYRERFEEDNGILREIDKYLEDKTQTTNWNYSPNHILKTEPIVDNVIYSNKSRNNSAQESINNQKDRSTINPLISLNDLWESKNVENVSSNNIFTQLQEERLRRQHCEKAIHALQGKLLEYQQKISVALQVDRSKDNAICNLQEENSSIKEKLQQFEKKLMEIELKLKEENYKLQNEMSDIKLSKECLEKELSQALNLAAKFQDKNEILEIKVENFTKSTDELKSLYSKQIEDMESRVLNAQKSEEIANTEIKKIQDVLAKTQIDEEKATKQLISYKKQFESLELKSQRIDTLEEQNKSLNESVLQFSAREKELIREIESQKISLKTHYQHQLEKVVEQKLVEFQTQLDSVEDTLRSEAKEREKTIAERAIKQLEMINEKNEQEILLINEKHNEEVELYRIQLINANKKNNELEEMLNSVRSRRVDMAEKLHTVMETQWQKALEILTTPNSNTERKSVNPINLNKDRLEGLSADSGITKPENESFDTPISSRNRTYSNKHDDRLQAYIELLLSKSPRDLDNLDAILNIPKNNPSSNDRSKLNQHSKPPWK